MSRLCCRSSAHDILGRTICGESSLEEDFQGHIIFTLTDPWWSSLYNINMALCTTWLAKSVFGFMIPDSLLEPVDTQLQRDESW